MNIINTGLSYSTVWKGAEASQMRIRVQQT